MYEQPPHAPIPWPTLILTFILSTILLVSLCLAILDTSGMELIRTTVSGDTLPVFLREAALTAPGFL